MEEHDKSYRVKFLVIGFIVCIIAGLFYYFVQEAREAARRSGCFSHVIQIGLAMNQYADEHDGNFPKLVDLDGNEVPAVDDNGNINTTFPARTAFAILLKEGYLDTTRVFICPSSRDRVPDESYPGDYRAAELNELLLTDGQCSYGWDPTKRSSARANCALVADKPLPDVTRHFGGAAENNSDNHRKAGQNVWYNDGHVKWADTSRPESGSDPDIYLGGAGYEISATDAKIIR